MTMRGNELETALTRHRITLDTDVARLNERVRASQRAESELDRDRQSILVVTAVQDLKRGNAPMSRQVETMLDRRRDRFELVGKQKIALEAQLDGLRAAEAKATAAAAESRRLHDEKEAALRNAMSSTDNHISAAAAVTDVTHAYEVNEARLREAKDDFKEKKKAYETDTLFAYLRKRSFGTPAYKGFGLFARLDGWLARVTRYAEAAANYDRLAQLPQWLEGRLSTVDETLVVARDRLKALEEKAMSPLAPFANDLLKSSTAAREATDERTQVVDDLAQANALLAATEAYSDDFILDIAEHHARDRFEGLSGNAFTKEIQRAAGPDARNVQESLGSLSERREDARQTSLMLGQQANDLIVSLKSADAILAWLRFEKRTGRRDIFDVRNLADLLARSSTDASALEARRHLDRSHRVEREPSYSTDPFTTGVAIGSSRPSRPSRPSPSSGGFGGSSGGWSTGGRIGGGRSGNKTGGGF